ncbi:MAG: TonB-dependent receptor [Fibrobacter sp.]|nr:TonB-dependent receptor [Fibrobacter sp.]
MRTTSFCKTATVAVLLCCAWENTFAQVEVTSKDVAVDDTAPVQDLGVSEISAPPVSGIAVVGTDYTEITASAWEGRGLSATEILSSLSGIQGYTQGGMGSFQTVSIRGIAARNILICLDGIPLNDASGGAPNIGAIDLNNIEKIEIYKDRTPAKFGGSGVGGVINFVSKNAVHASKTPTGRIFASYGSHNTFEGSAQINASVTDSAQFSATASMRHSDNDYEFTNRNGTLYNDSDDTKEKRQNAQFTEYSGNAQYRILHGNGFFSTLSGSISHTEAGNPGHEDSQTYVAKFTGDMSQLLYRLEFPELFGCILTEAGITGKFEKNVSASYYPLDKIGYLSNTYREYGLAGYRLSPEISGTLSLQDFEAFVRFAGSAERWESRGSLQEFGLNRYTGSIAGNAEYSFTKWFSLLAEGNLLKSIDDIDGGKVLMSTGTALISDATDRDLSLGGMLQAKFGKKDSWIGANASIGRFYRKPQLMELYGVYPGTLSNPNLKDETALKFAAGIYMSTPKKRSVLRATYFETHAENGIYWVTSTNLMKAFNIDQSLIRGVELELDSRPVDFFQAVLHGTIQSPRDEGSNKAYNGNLLPGEPIYSYNAEGTIFLPLHLSAIFTMDYRSTIFSDRLNFTRQPAVTRYNASLAWQPFEKTRLVFAVNNITDETYRNIYTPYPAPGREYKVSLIQGF